MPFLFRRIKFQKLVQLLKNFCIVLLYLATQICAIFHFFCNLFHVTFTDTDECIERSDVCLDSVSLCQNAVGTYQCVCKIGFESISQDCQGEVA